MARQSCIPRPSTISAGRASVAAPEPSRPSAASRLFGASASSSGLNGNLLTSSRAPGESSSQPSAATSARKSIFASAKKSLGVFGQTPQTKRSSMHPSSVTSSAGRRASVGGTRVTGEDRPITDPSYQRQCIERLNEFLLEYGQTPVSPKFVTCPSSNEIKRVFEILLSALDISMDSMCQQGKQWDSEIGSFVRLLGYRYPVAKKNLAVNSTTNSSRGQLFGLIEWMVDSAYANMRSNIEENLLKEVEDIHLLEASLMAPQSADGEGLRPTIQALIQEQWPDELESLMEEDEELQSNLHDMKAKYEESKETDKFIADLRAEYCTFFKYHNEIQERLLNFRDSSSLEMRDFQQRKLCLEEDIAAITEEQAKTDYLTSTQEHNTDEVRDIMEGLEKRLLEAKQESDKSKENLRVCLRDAESEREKLYFNFQNCKADLSRLYKLLSPITEAEPLSDLFDSREYKNIIRMLDSGDVLDKELDPLLKVYLTKLTQQLLDITSSLDSRAIPTISSQIDAIKIQIDDISSKCSSVDADTSTLLHSIEQTMQARTEKRESLNQKLKEERGQFVNVSDQVKSKSTENEEVKAELNQKFDSHEKKRILDVEKMKRDLSNDARDHLEYLASMEASTREVRDALEERSKKWEERLDYLAKKNKKARKAFAIVKERQAEKENRRKPS